MTSRQTGPDGAGTEASIEDDLQQPLERTGAISHRGVLAGVPLAIVGVLVLASVAFGATVIQKVVGPTANPTPVVVGAGQDETQSPATVETPAARATDRAPRLSTTAPVGATGTEPADPAPHPIADMGALVAADNLDMTVSFSWSAYEGAGLAGFELVYEATSSGKTPSYPTSPTWASPEMGQKSVAVPGIGPGDYQVRLQAICGLETPVVCGQTSVIHVHLSTGRSAPSPIAATSVPATSVPATPRPTVAPTPPSATPTTSPTPEPGTLVMADLGALGAADNLDMTVSFVWSPFVGDGLVRYELVYELTSSGRTPSFLGGSPAWASTAPGTTSVAVAGIGPGSYQVRVGAICKVAAGEHVCGQSSVIRIHLSAARFASPSPVASAQ